MEYLEFLETEAGESMVKLVHFNDSKNEINSKVDRHHPVSGGMDRMKQMIVDGRNGVISNFMCSDLGYIGPIKMLEVSMYCIKKNIDMVSEW